MNSSDWTGLLGASVFIAYFIGESIAKTKQGRFQMKVVWTILLALLGVSLIILMDDVENGRVEFPLSPIFCFVLATLTFFSVAIGVFQSILLHKELPKNRKVRKIDSFIEKLKTQESNCLYSNKANVKSVIKKLEELYKEQANSTDLSSKMDQLITVIIPKYVKQYATYSKTVSKFDTTNDTKVKLANELLPVSDALIESIRVAREDQVHHTGVKELTDALKEFNTNIPQREENQEK